MKDNLTLIENARTDFNITSNKDLSDFYSFFVGALQSHVDSEIWSAAVATAKDCYRCTRALSSV